MRPYLLVHIQSNCHMTGYPHVCRVMDIHTVLQVNTVILLVITVKQENFATFHEFEGQTSLQKTSHIWG